MRLLIPLLTILLIAGLLTANPEGSEVIVAMKPGRSVNELNHRFDTQMLAKVPGENVYLLRTSSRKAEAAARKIRKSGMVESAEGNVPFRLDSAYVDDRTFSGLSTDAAFLLDGSTTTTFYGTEVLEAYVRQPARAIVHADDALALSTGAGTRVAYVDTGVDPDHPALRRWLEPGLDLVNGTSVSELDGLSSDAAFLLDTDAAFLLDDRFFFFLNRSLVSLLDGAGNSTGSFPAAFGHGTLVAGAIHAVAPEARIVPIKAFDAHGQTTLFRMLQAIYHAADLRVDVLNLSFSTTEYSEALRKAISAAQAAGVTIVASIGNNGSDVRYVYPAAFPNVYGVAATDHNDRIAPFSNYGKSVSVTAPGAYVVSTAPGGRYAAAWGTSFSAPLVSGGIALVAAQRAHGYSEGPLVINTAEGIDNLNPGFERMLGRGRMNLKRAFARR